jgi:hypothetical protein
LSVFRASRIVKIPIVCRKHGRFRFNGVVAEENADMSFAVGADIGNNSIRKSDPVLIFHIILDYQITSGVMWAQNRASL